MLYKDSINRKSNQKNLGTIKSSNLCTEITEYTDHKSEIAVCNLMSFGLPKFLDGMSFDHESLHKAVQVGVCNLNKVIDVTFYPLEKAKTSNHRHRPIGIGGQGLADVFAILRMPFESEESFRLNEEIFETIYHAAVTSSMELAKKRKVSIERGDDVTLMMEESSLPAKYAGSYSTFVGCPAEQGELQFDLWGHTPRSGRYDWNALKAEIKLHGMRNSLLVAPMPTASTAQINGFNEGFEPFVSNIFKRKTMAGEFTVINKYLIRDLVERGLWGDDMKTELIRHNGSVQDIPEIPEDLKALYKTVWEMKQKSIIDMAAGRGPFICQSQSMNIYMEDPNKSRISSAHFYGWKKQLKTGCYYFRNKPVAKAQQFTVEPKHEPQAPIEEEDEEEETCLSCSA
jgi:ribonucleoside-diphosphate reductase alpha chain